MDKYPDLKKINGYNQIQVRNTVFNCEINNHGIRATIQDHLKISNNKAIIQDHLKISNDKAIIQDHLKISINKAIIQVHLKISINKAIIQDHQKISNNKANSAIILEYRLCGPRFESWQERI